MYPIIDSKPITKLMIYTVSEGFRTCACASLYYCQERRVYATIISLSQPQELVPVHPKYGVQDWDRAEGAVEWPRMVKALEEVSASCRTMIRTRYN